MSHAIRLSILAVVLASVEAAPMPAQQQKRRGLSVSATKSAVPADAALFVHVRAGDLVRSETMREVRQWIAGAGDKALEAFRTRFPISVANIEELTLFAVPGPAENPSRMPPPVLVVRLNVPIDGGQAATLIGDGARPMVIGGKQTFADPKLGLALVLHDEQTVVIGLPEVLQSLAERPAASGPLRPVIAQAARNHVTAALNCSVIPRELAAQLPPPMQPLLKAQWIAMTLDAPRDLTAAATLQFADQPAAEAAEKAIRAAADGARQQLNEARAQIGRPLFEPKSPSPAAWSEMPAAIGALLGLSAVEQMDGVLAKLPLVREGTSLRMQVTAPAHSATPALVAAALAAAGFVTYATDAQMAGGALGGMLDPAGQQTMNNMKQLGLAMHNYADAHGSFPPHAIYSRDGKTPLLSWRVALLPYLDHDELYKQFRLDEPWDSEHNRKLMAQMPAVFRSPLAPATGAGMTHFQVFVGGGAAWEPRPRGPRFADITDGLSNTIMIVESADAVPWTKPADISYDPSKPLPPLGPTPDSVRVFALFMDGSVQTRPRPIEDSLLRAVITRAGGEPVNFQSDSANPKAPGPPIPIANPPKGPDQ